MLISTFSFNILKIKISGRPICILNDRGKHFPELRELLLSRDYRPGIINSAIEKARNVPRSEALKRVSKQKSSRRPVFVMNFDPRLPSIPDIVKKHWRSMTQDPRLKEIFPEPPLVAYKRPPNIRDKLIRSKVPPPTKIQRRKVPGMKKCNKCSGCPFIQEGKIVKATSTNFKVDINTNVDCSTTNVIYLLGCDKCHSNISGRQKVC